MLNPLVKGLLIFVGGLVVGGGVGATASYFVTKKRLDKEHDDAIVELRIHYEELLDKYEPLNTESEEKSDISKNEDGVVTVGAGIPKDKEVNTQKLAYDKAYKVSPEIKERIEAAKERLKSTGPSEDDGEDEDIVEITTYEDEYTHEPGYGQKSGYYAIEMAYYTKDGGMSILDWGQMEDDGYFNGDDADMRKANEEDEIIYDIDPYLKLISFDHKPYDEIYLRNNRRKIDIKLMKRYSGSQEL